MGFEFTDDATEFFQRIGVKRTGAAKRKSNTGYFGNMLEAYWICVQIGIKHDAFSLPEKSREFVRDLNPISEEKRDDLIAGLGFYYHCKREGIHKSGSKEDVLGEMGKFFSEKHQELGDEGCNLFNGFANGGFNLLYSLTGDSCNELADVLVQCYELLSE